MENKESQEFERAVCERCKENGATRRRQNTQYCDDKLNFATLCPPCQEQEDEYWEERWAEYYSGLL